MSEEKTTGRRRGLDANKVAEAAKDMAAEKGFDGWRMRDLAKRLDVAPSVIYHYFPNREAVCDAAMNSSRATSRFRQKTWPGRNGSFRRHET